MVQDDVMKQHSMKSINLHLLNPNYAQGIMVDAVTYTQIFNMQGTNKPFGES